LASGFSKVHLEIMGKIFMHRLITKSFTVIRALNIFIRLNRQYSSSQLIKAYMFFEAFTGKENRRIFIAASWLSAEHHSSSGMITISASGFASDDETDSSAV
jgi:hypothetical protein